jgi:lipoate-protein ligase A
MAPSRGALPHLRNFTPSSISARLNIAVGRRAYSSFPEKLKNPANKVQSYISSSRDPYLNLSIEDHILRTSPPDSAVLFLYTNRPCVVIGRNQNPWHEVNLGMLRPIAHSKHSSSDAADLSHLGDVDLVRRRSGGGTVFHDEGNVNWSITCPRSAFTRDKHAEMVVRALRNLGVLRARVNERHDIVLDQGDAKQPTDPTDMHRTAYTVDEGVQPRPLKVSGSAYKLIRGRALHHATTLLASPNLHIIPQYLHSPAKPFIDAKGVESVSSPVGNIGLANGVFQSSLQKEFAAMYGRKEVEPDTVGDDFLAIPEIRKGYDELRTKEWILSQTPQFVLKVDSRNPPSKKNAGAHIDMDVHHGVIKSFDFDAANISSTTVNAVRTLLVDRKLQDVVDWHDLLHANVHGDGISTIASYLEEFLPIPNPPVS